MRAVAWVTCQALVARQAQEDVVFCFCVCLPSALGVAEAFREAFPVATTQGFSLALREETL